MLFKVDSLFGHVVEDTPDGPIYRDDGSKVDETNPRPCFGCKAKCQSGSHDPCIANLPGASQACCGHGEERTPRGNLAGYVGLTDGRTIRFSGTLGGERIRQAVDAALAGEPLPEGFDFAEISWWAGLSKEQVALVHSKIPLYIARIVREVAGRDPEGFIAGTEPWWEGLDDEQKGKVWAILGANHSEFVADILAGGPQSDSGSNV
jgi:hypothetical protein